MAKEFICAYSSCMDTDTPIVVTNKRDGRQDRYCTWLHAALGCLGHETHHQRRDFARRCRALLEQFIKDENKYAVLDVEFSVGALKVITVQEGATVYGAGRVFLNGLGMSHSPGLAVVAGGEKFISTDDDAKAWLGVRRCPPETIVKLLNAALARPDLNQEAG